MVVRIVREDRCSRAGARFVVEVATGDRRGIVGTFDEADTPGAERQARACAIRVARSLRCRVAA